MIDAEMKHFLVIHHSVILKVYLRFVFLIKTVVSLRTKFIKQLKMPLKLKV